MSSGARTCDLLRVTWWYTLEHMSVGVEESVSLTVPAFVDVGPGSHDAMVVPHVRVRAATVLSSEYPQLLHRTEIRWPHRSDLLPEDSSHDEVLLRIDDMDSEPRRFCAGEVVHFSALIEEHSVSCPACDVPMCEASSFSRPAGVATLLVLETLCGAKRSVGYYGDPPSKYVSKIMVGGVSFPSKPEFLSEVVPTREFTLSRFDEARGVAYYMECPKRSG